MKFQWYAARLRQMSVREIAWRIRRQCRSGAESVIPNNDSLPEQARTLREKLPIFRDRLSIKYFDEKIDWDGEDIPWQGKMLQSDLSTVRSSRIDYRNAEVFGDPKMTWELNRHQFLRGWVAEPDSSVADKASAVSHLLLHWIAMNRCGYGLNWTSSLEAGMRMISWEAALGGLGHEHFNPEVLDIIRLSAIQHSNFVWKNPSLYSSANNHLIGELTGIMAAASMFPAEVVLKKNALMAWKILVSESRKQVTTDGVSKEQALFYHAYVMLFLRRAADYAAALHFSIPADFMRLINLMQNFLDAATDGNGEWFEIGDRDDGNLLAFMPDFPDSRPVSTEREPGIYVFAEGGFAIWRASRFHVLFRCGEFGYPSIAAHAHCDQLSVLLKIDDRDILTDSGTCVYHENDKWRRYFRSTSAHNTVRVDGGEQASYGGPFLWNTAANGHMIETDDFNITGTTDAWVRGQKPVQHARSVVVNLDSTDILSVTDRLTPTDDAVVDHEFELVWNFAPGIEIRLHDETDKTLGFSILADGEPVADMRIISDYEVIHRIYMGDESVPAGFYSRKFGERIPIVQLRVCCKSAAWEVESRFSIGGLACAE